MSMKYDTLKTAGKPGPCRLGKLSPVSTLEMKAFLAVIINMGIIHLPEIPDCPFFGRVMS